MINSYALKIQSIWRGTKERISIKKKLKEMSKKKKIDKVSLNANEVIALDLRKSISKLGLTLEGLYRHCDQ